MIIRTHAYARAGLIGNPSDGYFGKTISVIVRDFAAQVTCWESPRMTIKPRHPGVLEFESFEGLIEDVKLYGYYGGVRLIKAACKKFYDYCHTHGVELPRRNCTLEYTTNIPIRVGLAGSSAIVTATMRALMQFYEVAIPKPLLPGVILSVELDELKIGAGLQDRVIQVYEGCVFMDFDRQKMQKQGHGDYEEIDPAKLPPIFIAYHSTLAEGTEVTHNDLRTRWNQGDKEVHEAIDTWAGFAQQARDLIVAGKGDQIAPLMNANFDLRKRLIHISEGNQKLIDTARQHGCSSKFAGSGGAIIGTYDGDPQRLERMRHDYEAFGARLLVPQIVA